MVLFSNLFYFIFCIHLTDDEIKAARRRMSTLNDRAGDLGDSIGGLSLDAKDDEKGDVSYAL